MKKLFSKILPLFALLATQSCEPAYAVGRIENKDVKSLADIQSSILTTTGTIHNGTNQLTGLVSVVGLKPGQYVYGFQIPANTTILSILSNTVTMSNTATAGATETVTFGGFKTQLVNDSKIYINGSGGLNETLADAIINGDLSGGGGGGGGGLPNLTALENKCEEEHFGVLTEPWDKSIGSGFFSPPNSDSVHGVSIDSYTASSTSLAIVWNPIALVSSDKNLDSTTNWSPATGGGNLTTSGTHKVGSASLQFDKTSNVLTNAEIVYDAGSASLSVAGYTNYFVWVNLPSITNLTDIELRFDIDGSNYQTFTLTTNSAGNPLATGWNLLKVPVGSGGTATGTGWTSNLPYRFFHIGVDTSVASQTYTAILVDAPVAEVDNPGKYAALGTEFDFFDQSNSDSFIISSSSPSVDGLVTITAGMSNSYFPGFSPAAGNAYRSSLAIGSSQAAMTLLDRTSNTMLGAVRFLQSVRLSSIFRSALSVVPLNAFVSVDTPQVYPVVSTTGSTIVVTDVANQSTDLLSGETVHVFRTIQKDGGNAFVHRGDCILSLNSTNSSGQTTINCTPPGGTVAGDYVAKKHLSASYSAVPVGSAETYTALTPMSVPDDVIMYDIGLPIPNQTNLYALYTFNRNTINSFGPGVNLTQTGSPTVNNQFLNGMFSASNWSSLNYFTAVGSGVTISNPAVLALSMWVYPTAAAGSKPILQAHTGSNGWVVEYAGNGAAFFQQNGATLVTGGTLSLNHWHHLAFVALGTNGANQCHEWVDGVRVNDATGTTAWGAGADLQIGYDNVGGAGVPAADRLAQLAIWVGQGLSDDQVKQLYNQGLAQILGFGPELKYRYTATGVSGQDFVEKATLQRDTTNVIPFIPKMGLISTQ